MAFWLIGEAPNPPTVGHPDLWLLPDGSGLPHTANRLLALTGWSLEQYLQVFDHRTNLWNSPANVWIYNGRRRAEKIVSESAADGSLGVVVLGTKAAHAFGFEDVEPLTWYDRFALVPHPSGRCRFWGSPDNRAAARFFFDGVMERALGAPGQGGRPKRGTG